MPFQKGVSGTPGGRPKKTETLLEIEALARQYAPQAMEALVKIAMTGKSDSARVAAATKPFRRKASQTSNTLFQTSL